MVYFLSQYEGLILCTVNQHKITSGELLLYSCLPLSLFVFILFSESILFSHARLCLLTWGFHITLLQVRAVVETTDHQLKPVLALALRACFLQLCSAWVHVPAQATLLTNEEATKSLHFHTSLTPCVLQTFFKG